MKKKEKYKQIQPTCSFSILWQRILYNFGIRDVILKKNAENTTDRTFDQ